MADAERRFTSVRVEVRSDDEKRIIGGYAAKFNRHSQNLGGFVERIAPSAFNLNRSNGWPSVVARYNHDDNLLLGTTGAGTLRLGLDEVGLTYEVDLPQARADIYELVQRGDVRQSSFAFTVDANGDEWDTTDQGFPQRTLTSVRLYDVAPVNTPAYEDTSVGLRSIEGALESLSRKFEADMSEVRSLAADGDLLKFFKRTDKAEPRTLSSQEALARVLAIKE